MKILQRILLGALLTVLAHKVAAQDNSSEHAGNYPGWIVGLGYVVAPDPFVGKAKDASQPFPIVGYLGERLTWLGPYVSYRIMDDDLFAVSAVAEVRFDGFDAESGDPLLLGLSERRSAVETGLDVDFGPLSLSARTDISGRHKGSSVELGFTQTWELGHQFGLETGVSAEWQSDDIVNYYYGVSATETSTGRPEYTPGSATNFGADVQLSYRLGDRSTLFLGVDGRRLDKRITRSPIVDDDYEFSAYVGFVYQLFE